MRTKKTAPTLPPIVIDTIEEKAQQAFVRSKDKRLLTEANGRLCRALEDAFPVPIALVDIEQIFAETWITCHRERR